jgi:Holliday junction resolvase RusA-like endonuclease
MAGRHVNTIHSKIAQTCKSNPELVSREVALMKFIRTKSKRTSESMHPTSKPDCTAIAKVPKKVLTEVWWKGQKEGKSTNYIGGKWSRWQECQIK